MNDFQDDRQLLEKMMREENEALSKLMEDIRESEAETNAWFEEMLRDENQTLQAMLEDMRHQDETIRQWIQEMTWPTDQSDQAASVTPQPQPRKRRPRRQRFNQADVLTLRQAAGVLERHGGRSSQAGQLAESIRKLIDTGS